MMRKFLAGLAVLIAVISVVVSAPRVRAVDARDRTLSVFNIHNGERLTVEYKKNGKFVPEAMEKLNYFWRDWRTNEPTKMDPNLFDIIWEIHEELGSRVPVHLISGYRSPKTNAKLRKKGGGQAKFSKHTMGQASDIHFPDVPVQRIRYSALIRQRGGVGYYPTSAKPFVHVDTGGVRMWPRMPRQELALLFPNGRSKYVPTDGRPISPADVKSARANYGQLAQAIAAFHQFRAGASDRTLVASLEPQQPVVSEPSSSADPGDDEADGAGDSAAAEPVAAPAVVADASLSGDDAPNLEGPALKPALTRVALADTQGLATASVPEPVLAPRVKLASLGDLNLPKAGKRLGLDKFIKGLNIEATIQAPGKYKPATKTTAAAAVDDAESLVPPEPEPISQQAFLSRVGWASAPEADDDHDSELSFRAFPLGPLLTAQPSIDNPVLAALHAPDLAQARDLIGRSDELGLGFLPRWQVAELAWGGELNGSDGGLMLKKAAGGNVARPVKTAVR